QRVVLREDRDRGAFRLAGGVAAVRRLEILVLPLDGEAVRLEELGELRRRLALLVSDLGLAVDRERELDERRAAIVDRADRLLAEGLRVGHDARCPSMSARITVSSARSASSNSAAACC